MSLFTQRASANSFKISGSRFFRWLCDPHYGDAEGSSSYVADSLPCIYSVACPAPEATVTTKRQRRRARAKRRTADAAPSSGGKVVAFDSVQIEGDVERYPLPECDSEERLPSSSGDGTRTQLVRSGSLRPKGASLWPALQARKRANYMAILGGVANRKRPIIWPIVWSQGLDGELPTAHVFGPNPGHITEGNFTAGSRIVIDMKSNAMWEAIVRQDWDKLVDEAPFAVSWDKAMRKFSDGEWKWNRFQHYGEEGVEPPSKPLRNDVGPATVQEALTEWEGNFLLELVRIAEIDPSKVGDLQIGKVKELCNALKHCLEQAQVDRPRPEGTPIAVEATAMMALADIIGIWLVDTGCGHDLAGYPSVKNHPGVVSLADHVMTFRTANDYTSATEQAHIPVPMLNETVKAWLLKSTPAVLTVGGRTMEGTYSHIWLNKLLPFFVNPEGMIMRLSVYGNIPYLETSNELCQPVHWTVVAEEYGMVEGDKIKGMKYSVLYMKAIKALQECMSRIEALENA